MKPFVANFGRTNSDSLVFSVLIFGSHFIFLVNDELEHNISSVYCEKDDEADVLHACEGILQDKKIDEELPAVWEECVFLERLRLRVFKRAKLGHLGSDSQRAR